MSDRDKIEIYTCEITNLREKLREMYKESGNPKIPPLVKLSRDIINLLEELIDGLDGMV